MPTILVGTTKGAFLIDGETGAVRGPFCHGWPINHVVADREAGTIFAAGGNDFFGAGVFRSTDNGGTWQLAKFSTGEMDDWFANDPEMAGMFGWTPTEPLFEGVDAIWSLHAAHGRVWAGAKPANLYVSDDGGKTWAVNAAFANFEDRDNWNPGAAGLVLHTLVTDPGVPKAMWLGVSAAGVFATEDGGASWQRRNRLSNAEAHAHHHHPAAPKGGETGHCVHNFARASDGRLYQQNHHGVFRSHDEGRSWEDVTPGLPSTFGFPIGVHPHDPETIWTIPLNGDTEGRFPVDARPAVWRSHDGGGTWEGISDGLPDQGWFTVLRQAMAVHPSDPPEVWFGTNTGSLFVSRDDGDTWAEPVRHLPTILSVETL